MSKQNKTTTASSKAIISPEEKKILELQEKQALLFSADTLIPQKNIDKELEKHWIYGKEYTIKELKALVKDSASDYFPMFPNEKKFFKLMFKLLGWHHLNPNSFIKPPIVALYIKLYIYGRFEKDVLPSLLKKDNPIVKGYIKKFKLFQFLNSEGLVLLEQYIKDAEAVMEDPEVKNWDDFEKKYTKLYKLSLQLKCIS